MNKPATDAATAPAEAAVAAERSLIDEVIRQTPQIPSPQFAIPRDWAEVEALAKRICDAGWCPKSHRDKQGKPNQPSVELAILQGMELGVAPLMAVQGIAIINGVPAIWGDLMLAVVTASGLLEFKDEFIEGKGDDMRAVCRVKRTTRPNTVRREFSVAMAKRAQLAGKSGPWQGYPSRMLAMRARSWALRDEFADVLRGMASMEELRDTGALDRAIAATESQGGTAADITAALKQVPAATKALVRGPEPGHQVDPETGEVLDDATPPLYESPKDNVASDEGANLKPRAAETPGDVLPDGTPIQSGKPFIEPAGDLLDRGKPPASKHAAETADGSTASQGSGHQPDETEWAEVVPGILDRIDAATSLADLDVIVASSRIKPDLDKMATAAPQQHRAVTGFIEEKRTELGG